MEQYHSLLEKILKEGTERKDRTGVGTISIFGHQTRYDIRSDFPVLTTKYIHFKSVVGELLWFLRGDTNIAWLKNYGISIWDSWADCDGNLGPIYGKQWRSWSDGRGGVIDQIATVIDSIKTDPYSRRHVISAWNVADIPNMALAPCHTLFQFYVQDDTLSCQLYQRSMDAFLGAPFNIASYSLLTCMIAQVCNLKPAEFIHTAGDAHIYSNHIEQVERLLQRPAYPPPKLWLNPDIDKIDAFTMNDIVLRDYKSHPPLKAPVAI